MVSARCSASAGCSRSSGPPGYDEFFRGLVERGVYVAPSQYEAMFVSLAHGDEEIERTVEAARDALADDRV